MKVQTKFNLHQLVFFLLNNKVAEYKVEFIRIIISVKGNKDIIEITYEFYDAYIGRIHRSENEIFETKKQLKETL